MNKKTLGMLLIFCVALMWAIEPILARFSYSNANVMQTLGIRSLVVAVISAFYVFATRGNFKVTKLQFSWLAYGAIFGTVIGEMIFLFALTKIPIIEVVMIGHTMPLYIIIMGFFFLKKEKLTRHDYIGIALMIMAAIFVTARTLPNLSQMNFFTIWHFLMILVSMTWASIVIIAKKHFPNTNAGTIVFYRYAISSLVLCAYLIWKSNFFVSNIYQILLGIAISAGLLLYFEALKRIKAAQASAFELVTPFFAAIFGFLFFQEYVTLLQIAGIVILVFGVRSLAKREA